MQGPDMQEILCCFGRYHTLNLMTRADAPTWLRSRPVVIPKFFLFHLTMLSSANNQPVTAAECHNRPTIQYFINV
jgi:hypothetical protein